MKFKIFIIALLLLASPSVCRAGYIYSCTPSYTNAFAQSAATYATAVKFQ